jgi:hypothetical protein
MLNDLVAITLLIAVILAAAKWGIKVLLIVAGIVILGGVGKAMAQDRCYVEAAPGGKSTCFLVDNAATLICDGQDNRRTSNCSTKVGEPVLCELRPTKLREPPDIWCTMPTPAPNEHARATLLAGGDRFRMTAPAKSASENTKSPVSKSATIGKAVCKFEYYAFGDEKGKSLAANAKEECLENEKLKQEGRGAEISREAYNFWLDNRMMNKRQIIQPTLPKTSTCTSNGMGGMTCREY